MKGVKGLKIVVMIFTKKTFVRSKWIILDPKMMRCCNSGSTLKIFLVSHNKRSQKVHQNYTNAFPKKALVWGPMGHSGCRMGISLV